MTPEKFAEILKIVESLAKVQINCGNGEIDFHTGWKSRLEQHYYSARDDAKAHTKATEKLLDRHKVAALMMIATIKSDPFEKLVPVPSARNVHARFWLAFSSGLVILRRWILADIKDGTDKSPPDMHTKQFIMPKTMNGDGDYDKQTVLGLYQAHMSGRLDPFLLANILFLIDAYHRLAWKPKEPS